jgi:hypothetical protein
MIAHVAHWLATRRRNEAVRLRASINLTLRRAEHLERVGNDERINRLDAMALIALVAGLVLLVAIGISACCLVR